MNSTIEQRLARLETQNTRLRLALFSLLAIATGGVAIGWTQINTAPDLIEAKAFRVVNDEGMPMIHLASDEDGGLIEIFNPQGNPTISIATDEDGGIVTIFNNDFVPVVSIFSSVHSGAVSLLDHSTKPVMVLGASELGGVLGILDSNKKTTVRLSNDEDGGRVDVWNPATDDSATFWADGN